MANKRKDFRTRVFDLIIVISSWISIISGIIAMFITAFVFQIINYRPYLLYAIISIMGLVGFRIWVRENVS
ncbi:MAG: hypothetical protein EU530_05915 [Promethearchaeota archaeon]|nr:MAG: hypothetical protein EU530_05915 [Candidatus Lokiarchaeota archaeon]